MILFLEKLQANKKYLPAGKGQHQKDILYAGLKIDSEKVENNAIDYQSIVPTLDVRYQFRAKKKRLESALVLNHSYLLTTTSATKNYDF